MNSVSTGIAKPTSYDAFTQYLKTSISEVFYNLLRTSENTHIMKSMFSSSLLLLIYSEFFRIFQKKLKICLVPLYICRFLVLQNQL